MARSSSPRLHLRRLAREYTVQLLYQWDVSGEQLTPERLERFWQQAEDMQDLMGSREWRKIRPEVEKTVGAIIDRHRELDTRIEHQATSWRVGRMPVVDRNILRLAVHELTYCPEIPATIVINEAVGIAKAFAGEDSSRFINALVDALSKLPRAAAPAGRGEPEAPPA